MTPSFRFALPLAALVLAAGPAAAAEFSQVLPEKSAITFTSKQMGVPVDGRFRRFGAQIAFDPAKPQAASTRIDVELSSIDAGSKDANDEVVGRQWLNLKAFPSASFVSTGVRPLGGNKYEAVGKLTIKGKSQDVVAPFTFRQDGANAVFDGGFVMKRLDFGIGEGAWSDPSAVANEVQIKFQIVAASAPAKK